MSGVFDTVSVGLEISGIAIVYAIAVLAVLSLVIKALTTVFRPKEVVAVGIAREEVKKVSVDEHTLLLALATVAVHRYLSERSRSTARELGVSGMSPWVSSWRFECSTTYGTLGRSVRSRRGYPYE